MLLILLPLTVAVLHPSLPTARLAHAHALVGRARDTYSVVATKHYLATAAASSGILRAGADLAGQCARDGAADPTHTLSMAAVATVVSGLCGAQWMRHLDSTLGDSTAESAGLVAAKAFADYTCFAPCANSAYLFLLPLLTGAGVEAATTSVVAHLPFLMQLEFMLWMPYNLIAFSHLPLHLRPATSALLSALFTVSIATVA